MDEQQPAAEFGCEHCWPSDAETAWEARRTLGHVAEIIDESHFHVMVLACPSCHQRFVSIFEEEVDWADGDDPQYWTVLPLTEAEASHLQQQSGSLTKAQLNSLGSGRRSLRRDHPKGAPPRTLWSTGISVV